MGADKFIDRIAEVPLYAANLVDRIDESVEMSPFLGMEIDDKVLNDPFWHKVHRLALATFISFIMEVPVTLIAICLANMSRIGRKGMVVFTSFMTSILCITAFVLCFIPPVSSTVIMSVALVGRLFSAAGFVVLYLFTAELFPTSVRSGAMGVLSMNARIAGILAPLVAGLLDPKMPGLTLLLCGIFSFASAILAAVTLPETIGKPMFNQISSLQEFYRREGLAPSLRVCPCFPCLPKHTPFNTKDDISLNFMVASTTDEVDSEIYSIENSSAAVSPDVASERRGLESRARDVGRKINATAKEALEKIAPKKSSKNRDQYQRFEEENVNDQGDSVFDHDE
eukprot:GHVP01042381.1.p1 GENE.GHVP01042381.1~~GHVP01042381.1.p1  ORF type:complete len:340 (-),score=44.68 GHVP01042381.1:500-1519(-)